MGAHSSPPSRHKPYHALLLVISAQLAGPSALPELRLMNFFPPPGRLLRAREELTVLAGDLQLPIDPSCLSPFSPSGVGNEYQTAESESQGKSEGF